MLADRVMNTGGGVYSVLRWTAAYKGDYWTGIGRSNRLF